MEEYLHHSSQIDDSTKVDDSSQVIQFCYNLQIDGFTFINKYGLDLISNHKINDLSEVKIINIVHRKDLLGIIRIVKDSSLKNSNHHSIFLRIRNKSNKWILLLVKYRVSDSCFHETEIKGYAFPITDEIVNSELFLKSEKRDHISPCDFELYALLTNREKQVLNHVCMGYTNRQIADQLIISQSTVETHRKKIIRKLKVKNSMGLHKYVEAEEHLK